MYYIYQNQVHFTWNKRGVVIRNKFWIYLLFIVISLPVVLLTFYYGGILAACASLFVIFLLYRYIYYSSDKIILRWYRCKYIPRDEHADMYLILEKLSGIFSVSCPKPYLFDSQVPIVFTVGSKKRSEIVMSYGLLELLPDNELEAIFAREIARISEGSVIQNTFVALIGGIIASFSTIFQWISMLIGSGGKGDSAPKFMRLFAMGLVMIPAAIVVYLASIDSTINSDVLAAKTLKDKETLISALKRIYYSIRINSFEYFNPGHVHLFAVNPVKVNSFYDVHLSLFDMKPDFSQRLKALEGADVN